MANCLKCGYELKPGDKFCDNCGTTVILPIKRQRLSFLPWVVGMLTAALCMIFLIPTGIELYRKSTGYEKEEVRKQVMSDCEVTVSDAVNETFSSELYGENTKFRYPKVNIEGRITDEANARIKRSIKKYYEDDKEGKYAANYTYYVNGNVVSILAEVISLTVYKAHYYFVFNISIETGKLLEAYEVPKQSHITDEWFFKSVKDCYAEYFETADLTDDEKEALLKHVSYTSLDPYYGEDGHLCFGIKTESNDGPEYVRFDVETKKELPSPITFN